MSGGSLNYFFGHLEDHVGDLGDRELDELVKDLSKVFHDREWYLSGDTSKGAYNKTVSEFKAKWFTEVGRKERFIRYIEETELELKRMLGLDSSHCYNCKHYTPWKEEDGPYGNCDFEKHCATHGWEYGCEKWETKDE